MRSVLIATTITGLLLGGSAAASTATYFKGNYETGEKVTVEILSTIPLTIRYCFKGDHDCVTHKVDGQPDNWTVVFRNGNRFSFTKNPDMPKQYDANLHHTATGQDWPVVLYERQKK